MEAPSENEELYFVRQELERRRKVAAEVQTSMAAQEQERLKALHWMNCPKCGMALQEITMKGVAVDQCSTCGGLWFDAGELERFSESSKAEAGFVTRFTSLFKP